jgi:aconitate hydratase
MVRLIDNEVYVIEERMIVEASEPPERVNGALAAEGLRPADSLPAYAGQGTIAQAIMDAHSTATDDELHIRFDALASHDITYVGIIQTARASGLQAFPVPYVLTNCHNTLCAVGGTINEDDHLFGLSAARRFGGIFVPGHLAVIHQYMREVFAGCGRMILGSDSHTRYGPIGTMGIGEGGPELVKQLLGRTYDLKRPKTVAVVLTGAPKAGIGPQDVALAIIKAVFAGGFVKNAVMEFIGPGIEGLSMDFRNGIDVMTTETACLSSIWKTDEKVKEYLRVHGREHDYKKLSPDRIARYDKAIIVDLDRIPSMIALPFHPSNAYPVSEFNANAEDMLAEIEREAKRAAGVDLKLRNRTASGRVKVEQGVIAGCAGGMYENITAAAKILSGSRIGTEFSLSVYPTSQPVSVGLINNGSVSELLAAGAVYRTAFCGPCFGAGDVPANNTLSIRHTTRNFINREGSKPKDNQMAAVALMDARSIVATARAGGFLTGADEVGIDYVPAKYAFDDSSYRARVYNGYGKPSGTELRFGPNIADWPEFERLPENLILEVASVIRDPVTTTDELIPSGETSSYRSNPEKLAQFTLSRRDHGYVGRARAVRELERGRASGAADGYLGELAKASGIDLDARNSAIGSVVCAYRPGDGSAREQAASCQRVLGGWANIAVDYATKRYRSNLVNWGMLPLTAEQRVIDLLETGDKVILPGIAQVLRERKESIEAVIIKRDGTVAKETLNIALSEGEMDIIMAGCLINYYARSQENIQ